MFNRRLFAVGVVATLLLTAADARAHTVYVEWKVTDTELVVVAYFNNDLPADDAEVALRLPDGTALASGRTDETGTWRARKPPPGSYTLSVKALPGHEKIEPIVLGPAAVEETKASGEDGAPGGGGQAWFVTGVVATGVVGAGLVLWVRRRRKAPPVNPPALAPPAEDGPGSDGRG